MAAIEHPFFVIGQTWSSCEPEATHRRYGLTCRRLTVGDVCISLRQREKTPEETVDVVGDNPA